MVLFIKYFHMSNFINIDEVKFQQKLDFEYLHHYYAFYTHSSLESNKTEVKRGPWVTGDLEGYIFSVIYYLMKISVLIDTKLCRHKRYYFLSSG